MNSEEYLGKIVKVKMDRPLGTKHPPTHIKWLYLATFLFYKTHFWNKKFLNTKKRVDNLPLVFVISFILLSNYNRFEPLFLKFS